MRPDLHYLFYQQLHSISENNVILFVPYSQIRLFLFVSSQDTNFTLPLPPAYKTSFGRVLGGFVSLNYQQYSQVDGHVSHVYLRLFTLWTGTAPLYLFVIALHDPVVSIVRQYAVALHRNATGWQTITMPRGALPISHGYFLAVGMHDRNSTNQIYIVENFVSFNARIGRDDTSSVSHAVNTRDGAALAYTVAHTGKRM